MPTLRYASGSDIRLVDLRDSLINPLLDVEILDNVTIDAAGSSSNYAVKTSKHADLLIKVGAATGSPSITFHVEVIEPTSGAVIRTYDGNSLSAAGADWVTIDNLTMGTYLKVTWDGTLDASDYFSNCYARLITKR